MRTTTKNKTTRVTISLPAAMVKQADRQGRIEMRNRSEMMREALRYYLTRIPTDTATPAELRAFRRGKAEIARGDFVTLTNLVHDMDRHPHQDRPKTAR
jgi:Arc/MetJ-type ribon-helix-helix transcriptional regulator